MTVADVQPPEGLRGTACDLDRFLAEQMENPRFRAGYEDSGDRARLTRRLTELRERAGLSQAEVAERAGLRLRDVLAYERGETDPRMSMHQRYARALGGRVRVEIELPESPVSSTGEEPTDG